MDVCYICQKEIFAIAYDGFEIPGPHPRDTKFVHANCFLEGAWKIIETNTKSMAATK
jgi:hypothetical protein